VIKVDLNRYSHHYLFKAGVVSDLISDLISDLTSKCLIRHFEMSN